MKILLAVILIISYTTQINTQCSSTPTRYCSPICRPEYCPQMSVKNCPSDDYYLTGACTDCNGCSKCEKYREMGDCCYSPYGTRLQCKKNFTCSPKTSRCEEIYID